MKRQFMVRVLNPERSRHKPPERLIWLFLHVFFGCKQARAMQYVQGKCIQCHAACILTEIPTATVWERNREVRVMQLLLCLSCFLIHAVCSSLTSGLSLTTILTLCSCVGDLDMITPKKPSISVALYFSFPSVLLISH